VIHDLTTAELRATVAYQAEQLEAARERIAQAEQAAEVARLHRNAIERQLEAWRKLATESVSLPFVD